MSATAGPVDGFVNWLASTALVDPDGRRQSPKNATNNLVREVGAELMMMMMMTGISKALMKKPFERSELLRDLRAIDDADGFHVGACIKDLLHESIASEKTQ